MKLDGQLYLLVNNDTKTFLRSIQFEHGFLSKSVQAFLESLVNDCKQHGITCYSPESAEKLNGFVRERTASRITGNVPIGDVTRTTTPVRKPHKNVTNLPSGVYKAAKKRSNGEGGKRRTKEEDEIS